jgi:hypothetical protein
MTLVIKLDRAPTDDPSVTEGEVYETVTCLARTRLHLINRVTGRVLGDDE